MASNLKCFLSYAHVDKDFVHREIAPVLKELGLDVWVDYERIPMGESIQDAIMKGIREAHLIVAVLNRRSTYVNFEVGAAIGQAKPTLAVLHASQEEEVGSEEDDENAQDNITPPVDTKTSPVDSSQATAASKSASRRVFITHGKDKAFIDPIKKLLGFGELTPVVSEVDPTGWAVTGR